MIIDAHAHIFSAEIIAAVSGKVDLVRRLSLEADKAVTRTSPEALATEAKGAGVGACLLLPTAARGAVREMNRSFFGLTAERTDLHSLGTLHPHGADNAAELDWFAAVGIRGAKLCSFSQGFDLESTETGALFDLIRSRAEKQGRRFFVLFDTFYLADRYFGVPRHHLTTPARLGQLVERYPEIDFVAAHMGGLTAPIKDVLEHLPPRENLYLETSNAAHTLAPEEFVELLRRHGSEKILFGTDWPWFGQKTEMERIERLLCRAGFDDRDQTAVFGGNIAGLLGISD